MFFIKTKKIIFILLFLISSISSSNAEFRVCNKTQNTIDVAIGYRSNLYWISEGWWKINPKICKTLIKIPLTYRFYYLYAEHTNGINLWEGTINMCVSEKRFKIFNNTNCFLRGFQSLGFLEIDTKNHFYWTVQLIE